MISSTVTLDEKKLTTDVAIIGSGAAGAILAHRLAKAGLRCIVLEEGDHFDRTSLSRNPKVVTNEVYRDSCFFATIGKPLFPLPLGKCLGGTTTINSGTCFRTPKHKIEFWQNNLGLTELRMDEFEESFEFVENLIGVEYANEKIMGMNNIKFKEGIEKLGLTGGPLFRNTVKCDGCGFCCYGCPSQAKQSMDVKVIPQASEMGAHFLVRAKVQQIVRKGSKIDSLLVKTAQNKKLHVRAKSYILSAGAIYSPSLLIKSKLGLKHTGNFLTIHPTTKVLAHFEDKLCSWRGIPQAYYTDHLKNEGITLEGVFLPLDVIGAALPDYMPFGEIIENYDHMAAFGSLIHDSHHGRVRYFPLIGTKAFYSLNDQDIEKFKKAILFMAKVYLKAGATKVYTFINKGNNVIRSERDLETFANTKFKNTDIEGMAFHPLGTCRMGHNKSDSVVDQNYKVHGLENLYVCDGSVVPTSLGVNPQITIMTFANRLANQIILKN